jgi:hypothetical protein
MDAIRYVRSQKEGYVVAFAGISAHLFKREVVSDIKRMKWKDSSDPNLGVGQFRMRNPYLRKRPVVVGKRQGLKGMRLRVQVQDVVPVEEDNARTNWYMPGSAEYVAALPPPSGQKGGVVTAPLDFDDPARVKRFARYKPDQNSSHDTIQMLKEIIRRSEPTRPK